MEKTLEAEKKKQGEMKESRDEREDAGVAMVKLKAFAKEKVEEAQKIIRDLRSEVVV